MSLQHLVPSWVEPDPLKGRAVDALGLQATADQIAEELLPGLSVLTNRARYFSLLAWARHACGRLHDEHQIHRLEVALAVREAMLHTGSTDGENFERCRFVGSRNLAREHLTAPPRDPRRAYRLPVWRAYRAAMQSLGLLEGDHALTAEGISLAKRFAAACRPRDASGNTMLPESACLSAMSAREAALLSAGLGIWRKGKLGEEDSSVAARRCATERELQWLLDESLPLTRVLAAYEGNRMREPSRTVAALREAAIWERLSVGLHAAFLVWLKHVRRPAAVKAMILAARRKRQAAPPEFDDIAIDDIAAVRAVQSVRRALALRARIAGREALPHCDDTAFELGEALVGSTPIDEVLAQLERRHVAAKGDDAWLRPRGRGKELAQDPGDTWTLPTRATLHGYRLGAFGQILVDLRRARWGKS